MLSYARMGAVDVVDLKMALALSCKRVREQGDDTADGGWASLLDEIVQAEYETEGLIDQVTDRPTRSFMSPS